MRNSRCTISFAWLAWLAALAACGCFRGGAERTAQPPVVPPTTAPAKPWYWVASNERPYRLPERGTEVAIDGPHALVVTGPGTVMRVELATGRVEPPVAIVPDEMNLESLVRIGPRLVGFGHHDSGRPAAWEITAEPLAATALAIDDPVPSSGGFTYRAARVSPDGRFVLVCDGSRWPTIRDARTLAAVWVLQNESCFLPWWEDIDRVVVGPHDARRVASLAARTVHDRPAGTPQVHAGPGGRVVELESSRVRLRDGTGRVLVDESRFLSAEVAWTPSGSLVLHGWGPLSVFDGDTGAEKKLALPDELTRPTAVAVDDHRMVAVYFSNIVVVADLATGAIARPAGNADDARSVAVLGHEVVSVAERLRVFSPSGSFRDGPTTSLEAVTGSKIAPIVSLSVMALERVDPKTGAAEQLGDLDAFMSWGVATATGLGVVDGAKIFEVDGSGTARPWMSVEPAFEAVALARDGRLLAKRADALHFVDPKADSVWSFQVSGVTSCEGALDLSLEPAGRRLAVSAGDSVHLVDVVDRRTIARISVEGFVREVLVIPGRDEVVMANEHEVILWQAATGRTLHWKHGVGRDVWSLATDGKALALGFHGGAVAWLSLDGLRSRGRAQPVTPLDTDLCQPLPALAVRDVVTVHP